MKSERRHELQHNLLADWLAKSAERIKPYQNIILATVLLVVVAVAGYVLWSKESAARTTQAWDELSTAMQSRDPAKLANVIADHPDTTVADMAAAVSADDHLAEGCRQLFVNKATAQRDLTKAIELFDAVRQHSRESMLLERATFGLARAKEAKGDATDIDEAMQLYEEVANRSGEGRYAAAATQRSRRPQAAGHQGMYDRFAHFDPKPAFSGEMGGKPAFDLNSLSNDGPLSLSDTVHDEKLRRKGKEHSGGEVLRQREAGRQREAADQTKPADEKKAPEKPAIVNPSYRDVAFFPAGGADGRGR